MTVDPKRITALAAEYADKTPQEILSLALRDYAPDVAISFSGAEDVVLVDMASKDADKRFAPFWRVFLKGNPLNDAAKGAQVEALEKSGGKVKLGE